MCRSGDRRPGSDPLQRTAIRYRREGALKQCPCFCKVLLHVPSASLSPTKILVWPRVGMVRTASSLLGASCVARFGESGCSILCRNPQNPDGQQSPAWPAAANDHRSLVRGDDGPAGIALEPSSSDGPIDESACLSGKRSRSKSERWTWDMVGCLKLARVFIEYRFRRPSF